MFTHKHTSLILSSAALAGIMMLSSSAPAGSPPLEVLAYSGLDNSPPGFPGLYWNLSSGMGNPVIDNSGKVAFGGTIFGDGITATNNRVVWYGDETGWNIVARSGNPTLPGLPGLNYTALNTNVMLSANGKLMVGGTLAGAGVAPANDTAFWYGPVGSHSLFAREGTTTVPGGAALATTAFGSMTPVNNYINNDAGQVLLVSNLTGGDVVVGTNDTGLFLVTSSGVTTAWRKGDLMPGAVAPDGPFMTPDNFQLRMNGVGEFIHGGTLVAGTAGGITTNNNNVLCTNVGGTMRVVVREDSPVEDFPTLKIKPASFFTVAQTAINNGGKILFNVTLDNVPPGTSVTTANDSVWLLDDHGAMSMAVREGDAIDGETFSFAQNPCINNNNEVALPGAVVGATNTGRLWFGPVGGPYTKIVEQGVTPVPGTTDAFLAFTAGSASIAFNNAGQMVFNSTLVGPGVQVGINDRGVFGWSEETGLVLIARTGVTILPELLDLSQLVLIGGTGITGDCGSAILSDNGWLVMRFQDVKGFQAIVRTQPFAQSCDADIDGSNSIDVNDLLAVISTWGACANPNDCPADVAPPGGDDVVDVNDLLAVITTWGACP